MAEKIAAVERDHPELSVNAQCRLLGLSKGSLHRGLRPRAETGDDLRLMGLIDRQYTRTPFYGSRRMVVHLRGKGLEINRKRVRRLMGTMGLEGVSPGANTSRRAHAHKIYPYLLRGLDINRPHQVWASDITCLGVLGGWVFLVAVMDRRSRAVLSWRLSNSPDAGFCVEALRDALGRFGPPEIFNTDQGCQYTSSEFTGELLGRGIRVSMDGKGRALDNVVVERFWRSLKYEEVYLKDYAGKSPPEVYRAPGEYIGFYNTGRPHSSLGNNTPWGVLMGDKNSRTTGRTDRPEQA